MTDRKNYLYKQYKNVISYQLNKSLLMPLWAGTVSCTLVAHGNLSIFQSLFPGY